MKPFWREVFSEPGPDGTGSASRVTMFMFALAAVAWITYVLIKTHSVPDLLNIAAFVLSPYGVNRVSGILENLKSK